MEHPKRRYIAYREPEKRSILPFFQVDPSQQNVQNRQSLVCTMRKRWFDSPFGGYRPCYSEGCLPGSLGSEQLGAAMQEVPRQEGK